MVSLAMAPLALSRIPAEYGVASVSSAPPMTREEARIKSEAEDFESALRDFGVSTGATDPMDFVDKVEGKLCRAPSVVVQEVDHVFTPGLYSRTIFMSKGDIVVSKIHMTKHQFAILQGAVTVWTKEDGAVTYRAPYRGVTNPGARRILYVHTDTIWTTYHPTDKTTVEEVQEDIIMKHENPLLTEGGQS